MQTLNEQQLELEAQSLDLGVARYRKTLEQGEADMPPGMKLLRTAVTKMGVGLTQWLDETAAGKASRSLGVATFLQPEELDGTLVCYVTCKSIINALSGTLKVQSVALSIAALLEDTVNYDALRRAEPRAYLRLLAKVAKSPNAGYRHVVMRRQHKYVGIKTIKWGLNERLRLGMLLVDIAAQTTGLFDIVRVTKGHNDTPVVIRPRPETVEWLEKSHSRCEALLPYYMPMVAPPLPWTGPKGGGYLSHKMQFPLVKGSSRPYMAELEAADLSMVYEAVNGMQDTRWRINAPLLRVLREVWDGGGNIGKLPSRDMEPMPPRTFTDAEAESNADVFRAWKKATSQCHERNAHLVSKRMAVQQKIFVAETMAKFDAFHYVHSLDFRGRAYAVGSFVTPQGDDSAKGLLEFADGKPLGETGAYWLAVHGANAFGVDKVSFDDRTQWVQDNHDAILESALNPLDGTRWWATAGSPYQFLAFCFEWSGLALHCKGDNPPDTFVSRLPVGLDGACNGLQNFSAMLRDEIGGAATNLIPSDTPSDIYSQVAAKANALIERDVVEGHALALRWQGKMTRKTAKRNTMTVPYAVTEFGMREQLTQEFRKIADEDPTADPIFATATMSDAAYIAGVNHEAIGQVVVAARVAMDWLREVARVVAADDLPVQWDSPSGFRVVQDYRRMDGVVHSFWVSGRRYRLTLAHASTVLNRRKQTSGISPNFVHALDAAHMHRTIGMCNAAGITHFAMIHDSYGTHACDVDTMARCLRESFVEQYKGDVLGNFRGQLVKDLPPELAAKLPPVPPFGTLELEGVLRSDYFFA